MGGKYHALEALEELSVWKGNFLIKTLMWLKMEKLCDVYLGRPMVFEEGVAFPQIHTE